LALCCGWGLYSEAALNWLQVYWNSKQATTSVFARLADTVHSGSLYVFILLLMWTFFTFILFIASMKHHSTLAWIFLTLLLGFIGLDFKELAGNKLLGTIAAWDLIVCALLAWYLMAVAVYAEAGINLPVGKPWIKSKE
jgi:succinate-acetate transporter protein